MATTFNFPAGTGRVHPDGLGLVDRHFTLQAERPADLGEVDLAGLDGLLRLLLFSDGSIVRALTVHSLAPVAVSLVHQEPVATAQEAASWLAVEPGERSVRRRVLTPGGFAESHLVPARLPEDFLPLLLASPSGIGEALRRSELEARRELLWFGLGKVPDWAAPLGGETLVRAYRIVTGGAPAILIREGFGVRLEGGVYTLAAAATEVSPGAGSAAPA